MKIGFTGTRLGMTPHQRHELQCVLAEHRPDELHHGQCIGADAEAHEIAIRLGVPAIVIHPPRERELVVEKLAEPPGTRVTYLPAARALRRNRAIVRAVDVLMAAPASDQEEVRSGTWSTIRFARREGRVEVIVLKPA